MKPPYRFFVPQNKKKGEDLLTNHKKKGTFPIEFMGIAIFHPQISIFCLWIYTMMLAPYLLHTHTPKHIAAMSNLILMIHTYTYTYRVVPCGISTCIPIYIHRKMSGLNFAG